MEEQLSNDESGEDAGEQAAEDTSVVDELKAALAESEARVRVLDARGSPEDVHARIRSILQAELPESRGYATDISDRDGVAKTFARIRQELGPVEVLVHNAAAGAFNSFMDLKNIQVQ